MGWGSNKVLLIGIALSILMIVGLIYIPILAKAFDNQVFPAIFWPILAFFALILYTLEWFRKGLVRRKERKHSNQLSDSR
jgi:MFS-type transporter involved in bile tolerance (Atg22 family)